MQVGHLEWDNSHNMKIDWTIYQVFQWIFELSTIIYSLFYCFNQYTFLIFRPPLFQSPSLKSKCPSVRNTISLGRFFITIFVFDLETAGLFKSRRLKIPETSEFLLDIFVFCTFKSTQEYCLYKIAHFLGQLHAHEV